MCHLCFPPRAALPACTFLNFNNLIFTTCGRVLSQSYSGFQRKSPPFCLSLSVCIITDRSDANGVSSLQRCNARETKQRMKTEVQSHHMVQPHEATAAVCWWYIIHCNVLALSLSEKKHNPGCGCSRRKEKTEQITQRRFAFSYDFSLSDCVRVRPHHLLGSGYHVLLATAGGAASIHWLADLPEINDQKVTMRDFVPRRALSVRPVFRPRCHHVSTKITA